MEAPVSLMDAMLFDEYRDPNDLWLTPRQDGMKGSGSVTDPLDTGEVAEGAKQPSALEFLGSTLVCICQDEHGFTPGQTVIITGVLGPSASLFNTSFLLTAGMIIGARSLALVLPAVPTVPIGYLSKTFIALSTVGSPKKSAHLFWPVAKASLANSGFNDFDAISVQGVTPAGYNGITQVVGLSTDRNSFYFRLGVMASLPTGTVTALGTCFRWVHRFDQAMRAMPTSGKAIVRVGNTKPGSPIKTRGQSSLYYEDLSTTLRVGFTVHAPQRIVGSGIDATEFKLVHAMCSVTPTTLLSRVENLGTLNYFEASDFTLNAAIADQFVPYQGTSPDYASPIPGVAPVVMEAAGPLKGANNRLRRVRTIHFGTQSAPECFPLSLFNFGETDANNVITDCVTQLPGVNNFHESTVMVVFASGGTPDMAYLRQRGQAGVLRYCYSDTSYPELGASSAPIGIKSITLVAGTADKYLVETFLEHKRTPLTILTIAGVTLADGTVHPYLNGSFLVTNVSSSLLVEILVRGTPTFLSANVANARVGADWHGPEALGGTGCVSEGNSVYDCTYPFYQDTGSGRDVIYRNNYCSGAGFSAYGNMNPGRSFVNPTAITAVTRPDVASQPSLVRVTTSVTNMRVGDIVLIENIIEAGVTPPAGVYTGRFTVKSIDTGLNTFDYNTKTTPTGAPSLAAPPSNPRFYDVWVVRRYVFENNVFDLHPWPAGSWPSYVRGFVAAADNDSSTGPNVVFPEWVIRENQIRFVDNAPTTATDVQALAITNADNCVLESNLLGMASAKPIYFKRSVGSLQSMQNRAPNGDWVKTWDEAANRFEDDILSRIEDALSL